MANIWQHMMSAVLSSYSLSRKRVRKEEDSEDAKSTKKHEKILYNPVTLNFYNVHP
jgi:hypothetical protein